VKILTKVQHHKKWEICWTFSTQRHKKSNCCLGPLWKYSTCTLHLLLVVTLKARYLHIASAVGDLFESLHFWQVIFIICFQIFMRMSVNIIFKNIYMLLVKHISNGT